MSGRADRLTERQREIVTLVAQSYSAKAIAYKLHIADHTVWYHFIEIEKRLGAHDAAFLTRYAIATRMVPVPTLNQCTTHNGNTA